MSSLFEKLGGKNAIDAAVDIFYDKVLADDRIRHFFVDTDMVKQRGHQKRFLTYAFGGMPSYPGRALRESHKDMVDSMGLTDLHFDAVIENLAGTLQELGVANELIAEAGAVAESVRNEVLDR